MQIFSNITNFNISQIAPIKTDYQKSARISKTNADAVNFGANINYKKAKNIYSAISKADRIGILVHKDVDADALSSGILFLNLIKRRYKGKNKDVQLVINQKIPKYLTNMPGLSDITQYNDLKNKKFDTVIVLDCDETRVDCYDILKNANTKINIDHHKNRENNPLFSKNLRIMDSDAVSTTQVIYDNFFLPFGAWPNKIMMECIMTGIVTDTGNFKNIPDKEKFSKSMKSLSQYTNIPLPVLAKKINNKFDVSKQRSKELEKLFTDIVEFEENLNTYITPDSKKVSYILIDQKLLNKYNIKDDESDIKETLNHIIAICRSKYDIAATLWERKNGDIRLSMRSSNCDVLNIAEEFGGGGHEHAAGATVSGTLEEALEKVLSIIDKKY